MKSFLRQVDLNLTDRCNLACTYCSVPVRPANDSSPEISLDQLRRLFDEFEELKVALVRLAGGEPFLRRDIVEIMSLLGHRSFSTIILTNGVPIRRHHLQLAAELPSLQSIAFSVDGIDRDRNHRSRGCPSAFQRVVSNIEACSELGIKHSMMTVVTDEVVGQMRELVQFAAAHAMSQLRFILLGYAGAAQHRPEAFPTWDSWRRSVVELTRYLRDTPMLPVHILFPHEDPVPRELYEPLRDAGLLEELERVWGIAWRWHGEPLKGGVSICHAGRDSLTILPNGDAYGCDLMRNLPSLRAGNVFEQGVRAVFEESSVLNSLRRAPAVLGCASFEDHSQTFACGQCRAGNTALREIGLLPQGRLPGTRR